MPVSFATDTITVIRPTYVVERGDEIPNWDLATEHEVGGCTVQPMATEEVLFTGAAANEGGTARDAVVTRWKVYGPADGDVDPRDRVRYRGVVYEVNGQVQDWPSATGALDHIAFELRDVQG